LIEATTADDELNHAGLLHAFAEVCRRLDADADQDKTN
jgi:hypothetical protein